MDQYSNLIYSEQDLCDVLLRDPDHQFKTITVDFDYTDQLDLGIKLVKQQESNLTLAEWDRQNQVDWFMPNEYKNMDIAKWILDQCTTEEELQRCGAELLMYVERDLTPLLQWLKYLVDTMRANNIIWGVGRGSSVASYVLYKLGVHRVNSIEYELDVNEFLR
jgi:DNA polymerase-3 subunit alpha